MNRRIENNRVSGFSIPARLRSFHFAWQGLIRFFKEEHNARIHLAATIIVILFAIRLKVDRVDAVILTIVVGLVWIAEIFNTAIEKTMDHLSPRRHPEVKYIKDLSAAAVLVSSIVAIIVGAVIFIPKFF
jgi:diacylglycerol kinase